MKQTFKIHKTWLALLVLAVNFSLVEWAVAAQKSSNIEVVSPYVREAPANAQASAAFMTLKNHSDHTIHLVKAYSKAAKKVELHTHLHENGMMKMRQVDAITVPKKGEVALKPGGYHIMLIGLIKPLKNNDKVRLTLEFDDGSQKQLEMPVTSSHSGHGDMMSQHNH